MSETIRSFIAIELDASIRQELSCVQQNLREMLGRPDATHPRHKPGGERGIKWVDPENIHLTLRFLGDVPEEQLAAVQTALGKTAAAFPAFQIELAGLGAFPDRRRPRIVWIGVGKGTPQLANMVQSLETNLAGLQIKEEVRNGDATTFAQHPAPTCVGTGWTPTNGKPMEPKNVPLVFAAHITIGRVHIPQAQKPLALALETLPAPCGFTQQVNKLTLFRSQLTSAGPIYSVLAEARLTG